MARVQARDKAAFARLVDRHLTRIASFSYRMTGNRADAEDLAQETFLRVWHRANTWQPGRVRLTTWLHRVTNNLAIDQFRKRDPEPAGIDAADLDADGSDPVDSAATGQRVRRVRAAVEALPERQRTAIVLCQLEGWSNKDAAAIMEVSVDAIESLLARARRTLKSELADQYQEA